MKKIGCFIVFMILFASCSKEKSKQLEELTQGGTEMSLDAEIVQLSEDFPYGLTINDKVLTHVESEYLRKTVLAEDGSLYLLSNLKNNNSTSDYVYYGQVSRVTPDGVKDLSFGTSGNIKVHSNFGNKEHYLDMNLVDNKLKIFGHAWHIAGQAFHSSNTQIDLTSQTIDTTYGTNGFSRQKIAKFTLSGKRFELPNGDSLQVVLVGSGTPYTIYLSKLNSQGELVTSFGNAGLVNLGIQTHYNTYLYGHVDSGGSLYLSYLEGLNTYESVLIKINPDGSLNTDFANNGYLKMLHGSSNYVFDYHFKDNEIRMTYADYENNEWVARYYRISPENGEVLFTLKREEIKLPNDKICTMGQLTFYKTKILLYCSFDSKSFIVALNEDYSLDEHFGEDGLLEITTPDYYPSEIHVDNDRQVLWLAGIKKIANDAQKYIIKIKLEEVYF